MPFIFESRLAWNFIPDSCKINLQCDEDIRYKRIQEREGGILDDIIIKNKKREMELEQRYALVYPNIVFPPHEMVFDLNIDGSYMSPDEIVERILEYIKK